VIFTPTDIAGAYIIDIDRLEDDRGFFARSYCRREFEEHDLNPNLVQCNISFNRFKGTLRGLHSQKQPHQEAKVMRCTRGALYDVILDLRPDSPTWLKHVAVELTTDNHRMLYAPEGVFHGFLTLEDDTEIFYQMSEYYVPKVDMGVRWNDPAFGIAWPMEPAVISDRDRTYPDFDASAFGR
jgi:dTDP-4-dehydrorhamnose 3,5-epimerase